MRTLLLLLLLSLPAWAGRLGGDSRVGGDGGGGAPSATVTYPIANVQVGSYLALEPNATGGTPSGYTLTSGALPDGLQLVPETGEIYGTVTTDALLFGEDLLRGTHIFAVTAAGVDVIAVVEIHVYGNDIPNPESLAAFSPAQLSGSDFTDAVNGAVTWTKAAGTTDSDLTETTSPLGYGHTFDGSTHFTATDVLTEQSSAHTSVAMLFRTNVETAASGAIYYAYGWASPDSKGVIQFATRRGALFCSGTGSANNCDEATSTKFESTVHVSDSGVGKKIYFDGREQISISDGANVDTTGTAPAHLGTYPLSPGSYRTKATFSEVAWWPRVVDATHAAVVEWCWRNGISLEDCDGLDPPNANVTITPTAPAYERPVTCTGSYTLTGSTTNAASVTWRTEPAFASGVCTGTSSYSCAVTTSPIDSGDGVNTVTISAIGADGEVNAIRQDVGFYVTGARDCFLSQSIDGLNNTTNADNDAVTTWVNLISSSRNVTQSTAGAKPSVQEGINSGVYVQPLVRFDGGDNLCDDTAADHVGYSNGTDFTVFVTGATTSTNPAKISHLWTTRNTTATTTLGMALTFDDSSANDACRISIGDGSSDIILGTCSASALVSGKYHSIAFILDDDAGGGVDGALYGNNTSLVTPTRSGSYSASAPTSALCLGNEAGGGAQSLTGDIFAALGYTSALTSTQRGINKAVDEWALGNSLPVNP